MTKELAYICVESPDVQVVVDGMGEVISSAEVTKLLNMASFIGDDFVTVITPCQEGSPKQIELEENDRMDLGHKYSVVKEVDYTPE